MDRLQVAIEKARTQRAETLENRTIVDLRQDDPLPGTVPPQDRAAARTAPAATGAPPARPAIWQSLRPFDTKAKPLRNNRLLTLQGGGVAVPFDLLRTRMLQQMRQNGWRRVGVVSPSAACGKTTTAANLAFAFNRQPDLTTIMLDLDLRRPRLGRIFGQKVEHGMEDVLRGQVAFVDHALRIGSNVAVGLNRSSANAPSELLQSAVAKEQLAQIEADFAPDLMLIDLPPMMSTDENFGFLANVDCVLLMVAAEQSTMDQIDVTLRQLNDLTQVLGVVLNKCRHVGGAYGYDNKYYYS